MRSRTGWCSSNDRNFFPSTSGSNSTARSLIIHPEENSTYTFPARKLALIRIHYEPIDAIATLMSFRETGAGFYSSLWGPLPFVLAPPEALRFRILRLPERYPGRPASAPHAAEGSEAPAPP